MQLKYNWQKNGVESWNSIERQQNERGGFLALDSWFAFGRQKGLFHPPGKGDPAAVEIIATRMDYNLDSSLDYRLNYCLDYTLDYSLDDSLDYSLDDSLDYSLEYFLNYSLY